MNPTTKRLALLLLSALLGAGCFSSDEARSEFCLNADAKRRGEICGEDLPVPPEQASGGLDGGSDPVDAGPTPDGGSAPVDAGPEPACTSSAQCNTPNGECYEAQGACVNGRCAYVPKGTGTTCNATPPTQCFRSTGTCSNGSCVASAKPNGASCNDGNACTNSDACDGAGSCTGTSIACNSPPPTQCHQAVGTCNPSTGCTYAPKPAGSACNDNNTCTSGDACDGNGQCMIGGTTVVCEDRFDECLRTVGCDPQGGCIYENKCAPGYYCGEFGRCCPSASSGFTSSTPPCGLEPQ
jgi:hypothetical protein